ncbi:MAG: Ig-like domain-containing protein [Lachnospiraceae bacterium]|nr:Ig-like domain-containing protein [Lachnospiraceae bacterium]
MKKNRVLRTAKKCLALTLATFTMVVGAMGGMTFSNVTKEVEAEAATSVLSGEDRNVIFANSRTDFRDESIYFVMVTRYYNGDESNDVQCWDGTQYNLNDPAWRGDFKGLIEKLDYIKALGFTAIWITPVVENCSGYDYHGYHAKDFTEVDERYESDDCTYQDLIDAVHAKDMKIIQDVVYNHTGNFGEDNLMPMFDKVGDLSSPDCLQLSEGTELPSNYFDLLPAAQYQARLALMKNTDGVNHDVNNLYHHYGNFNWDDYTCQIAQIAGDCVDLNTENPLVYNYLVDAYTKYIDMGVDGFRVDTVRHISRLTLNKVFNQAFKEAGKKNGKDFFMFGEVCTRDNGNYWYRQSPSMSTPFYTWKESVDYPWSDTDWEVNYDSAIQCTLDNADASTIANQPTSTNAHLNGNEYHTPDYSEFSGLNVIDFPMHWSFKTAENAFNVAKNGDKYYNDATWNVTYVDSHDYAPDGAPEGERFNQDQSVWAENLSLMFTFRGIPCIYYGSETEFQKGAVIDKGPNIALAETGRAYYGDNIEGTITAVDFGEYGNVSGAVGETLKHQLSQHIQRLNRLRQAIPALRKGQYSTEGVSGNLAFKRRYTDANTDSFVCVSISGNATFTGIPNGTYVDAVTGDTKTVTNGTLSVSVSGKGNLKAYVLNTTKTPAPGRVITNGLYLTDGGAIQDIEPIEIEEVAVTGISLDKSSVSVLEGENIKVTATITPSDATYKTIKWTSSNTSVATVAGGNITGIAPGTATITATTKNGKTATVKVTVSTNPNIIKPMGVSLSPSTLTITVGNTGKLTATVSPENTTDKSLTWTSSDTSVATVNKSGVVTAVAEGTATITATTFNGYKATATVTVEPKEVPTLENGVYFEKPSGWGDTINVYMWSDSTGQKYMGAWPGTAIENLGDNLYGFSYKSDVSDMKIIFNDGSNQTANLEFVNNGYYNQSGLVYVVDTTDSGKVIVKYVDESGNVLSSKTLSGTVGSAYTTEAITIDGYTLKTSPSNATGTYTSSSITVTYVYKKIKIDDGGDETQNQGWVQQNGKWYYYDNSGVMQTSKWIDNKYYVKADGSMAVSEFVGNYYLDENGVWVTGSKWLNLNGTYYYIKSGIVQKSKWVKVGSYYYYFNASGVMQANKWINNTYYVKSNGVMATSEFVGNYYVDENGVWITGTKWVKVGSDYYYLVKGVAQKSKWLKVGSYYYYFNANGVMQANKWINNKYYVKSSGAMAVNEFVGNYYVDANGAWVTGSQWLKVNDEWYYIKSGIVQKSKWVKVGSYYYYFDASGVMQTSKWINGTYYVKANGAMAVSEWVDGGKYYVDANGKWVKNP